MIVDPRTHDDYAGRQVDAARRVLIDLGQVLGSFFTDSIVVVGGWVPELMVSDPEEPHVGSIDVDLALDADKLRNGRYAEVLETLLATRRYVRTEKQFKLQVEVDLEDGGPVVVVDVDFLKPLQRRRRRRGPRLTPGFRPLDADACEAAFVSPTHVRLRGVTVAGAENRVTILVASVEDFLIMKAHALAGRDKPKDAYDICYCLDNIEGGIAAIAKTWRERHGDELVGTAIRHLDEKFETLESYGPAQVAAFYNSADAQERQRQQRRAYELVRRFIELLRE